MDKIWDARTFKICTGESDGVAGLWHRGIILLKSSRLVSRVLFPIMGSVNVDGGDEPGNIYGDTACWSWFVKHFGGVGFAMQVLTAHSKVKMIVSDTEGDMVPEIRMVASIYLGTRLVAGLHPCKLVGAMEGTRTPVCVESREGACLFKQRRVIEPDVLKPASPHIYT